MQLSPARLIRALGRSLICGALTSEQQGDNFFINTSDSFLIEKAQQINGFSSG